MVRAEPRRARGARGRPAVSSLSDQSAVARDDWDRHWHEFADAAAGNPAKAFRHRLVVEALGAGGPPARVLDAGSGAGDLAARIRAAYPDAEIFGLELSRTGVERSRALVPDATFVERDLLAEAEVEPEHLVWATHAVCSEVLEHLDRPEDLLTNVRPYLAPSCRLVVTVPSGPMSAFDRRIGHRRHFTRAELAGLLARAGFRVEWVHGAGFPVFNLYRLVVIARGERLAGDVARREGAAASPFARAVMSVFFLLFRAAPVRGTRGWQLVASAVLRD